MEITTLVTAYAHVYHRLRPKKLPRKLSAAKSKRNNEIAISRTFDKESEVNEVEAVAVVEAVGMGMTMIRAHHEIQDHLLLDGEARQVTVDLHPVVTSTLIFLLAGVAVDLMRGAIGRLPRRDHIHILDRRPEPHRVEGIVMMPRLDHGDGNIPRVDLERLPVGEDIAEIGIEGDQGVVMIEQGP